MQRSMRDALSFLLHPVLALASFSADIHLPVMGSAEVAVTTANEFLSVRFANEVNLTGADLPHVTLYLTEFTCPRATDKECVNLVKHGISGVLEKLGTVSPCRSAVTNPYPSGSYAMLNVSHQRCLQYFSDTIVNATYMYAKPNQTVPGWVWALPEPERSRKVAFVKKYGSPNVFSEFDPHVTIGYGENATEVAAAVEALDFDVTELTAQVLAIAGVGAHGTVLRGHELARFQIAMQ